VRYRPRATLAVALQESPAQPQGEMPRPYIDRAGASPAPTFCELLRGCWSGLRFFFGSGPVSILRQLDLLILFSHLL
jgi:hypothetical protein